MVYGVKFMRAILEENMTAFAIRIVAEPVEEHDGPEELLVGFGEIEVVIFGIVFDQLLERSRAVGTLLTQCGERDDVKAKMFAHKVRGNFPARERVLREIPKRLLAAQGLVNGTIFPAFMMDSNKKCVIRAKGELARDFIIATL